MSIAPASRYPADPRAVFILAFCVFTGLTALVLDVAPGSLEKVLPGWAVVLWGSLLALGSLVTLVGMARQSVNGIIAEQVGSVMVGVATVYYSIVGFVFAGPGSIQIIGIVFAWGLACCWRWAQLRVLIKDGVRKAREQAVLERVQEAVAQARADQ